MEGYPSVKESSLRVPTWLRYIGVALDRSERSPVGQIAMSIVHIRQFTRYIFDVGMKWTPQVQSTPASQVISKASLKRDFRPLRTGRS